MRVILSLWWKNPKTDTLQAIFRVVNDMRSEMNARFEQVDARFDKQDAELAAIRKVLNERGGTEDGFYTTND